MDCALLGHRRAVRNVTLEMDDVADFAPGPAEAHGDESLMM